MGPAPDRKLGGGSAFALCAMGGCYRFQRGLRIHPAAALGLSTWTPREGTRCCVWSVGMGSAGWVLRPTGSSGEDRFSRCARGKGVIASNAGYGPIPLPPWGCRQGFSLTPDAAPMHDVAHLRSTALRVGKRGELPVISRGLFIILAYTNSGNTRFGATIQGDRHQRVTVCSGARPPLGSSFAHSQPRGSHHQRS